MEVPKSSPKNGKETSKQANSRLGHNLGRRMAEFNEGTTGGQTKHDGNITPKITKEYAAVFNSTTLGCLRRIDTRLTGLNYSV